MAAADRAELVFVVAVSSLTKKGFADTAKYEGKQVELEFDDGDAGVFISAQMAKRLHVRKGSKLSLVIEDEGNEAFESSLAGVGRTLRISDAKVYYAVGRSGGAIIRIRKDTSK